MATTKLLTAEDLWEINEPGRYDLIRGELHQMAPSGGQHSAIGVTIAAMLWNHVRQAGAGVVYGADAGFILARDPDVLLSPDVAFVRADRLPPVDERVGFLQLAPDLAVGIVSPSDRASEVEVKVQEYLKAGTLLVLIVQPKTRSITAYAADRSAQVYVEGEVIDLGEVVPGFQMQVRDIFE